MSLTHFLHHADRNDRHRARVAAGTRAPDPVYDHRARPWGGERPLTFFAKRPGAEIPAGSVVIAARLNAHGQYLPLLIEAFEGDHAGFASFPRLALMLGATELQIGLMDGTMRERVTAVRRLTHKPDCAAGSHPWLDRTALLSRPLSPAGAYDRSAIMATACAVAKSRQSLTGETWGACLSAALKGVWTLARTARLAALH